MSKVFLQLSNGNRIEATYEEDEWDDIYDRWRDKGDFMPFSNCVVLVKDVIAIEYEE